jgi:catechol 2,3-dioxygenase-like lactoylglutathione lyase family enzyme
MTGRMLGEQRMEAVTPNATETVGGRATRVASAVLFVSRLDRSVAFYGEVFLCRTTIRAGDAALLLDPEGFQIYLIARGTRAEHAAGGIGFHCLIWAVDSDEELRRLARVLQHRVGRTDIRTSGGVTFLSAHDPDGNRLLIAHPSPESQPRAVIGSHLYV